MESKYFRTQVGTVFKKCKDRGGRDTETADSVPTENDFVCCCQGIFFFYHS